MFSFDKVHLFSAFRYWKSTKCVLLFSLTKYICVLMFSFDKVHLCSAFRYGKVQNLFFCSVRQSTSVFFCSVLEKYNLCSCVQYNYVSAGFLYCREKVDCHQDYETRCKTIEAEYSAYCSAKIL